MDVSKKILEERKRHGYSQEKIEELLNLPQKAMSRIENGQRQPSTLELSKFAELFNIPIADFFNDNMSGEDITIALHRKTADFPDNDKIQKEVDRCILICKESVLLEKLLDMPSRSNAPFFSVSPPRSISEAIRQGEQAAKEERRKMGISTMPIGDIEHLLNFDGGVWCTSLQLPSNLSGLFLYHRDIGRVIIVNSAEGKLRKRFSYAHEYGHAVLDGNQSIIVHDKHNEKSLVEVRANAFGGAFLMPAESVLEILHAINKGWASRTILSVIDGSSDEITEVEERKIAKNQKLSPMDIAYIAHHFEVSYQMTVYRLQRLGHLSAADREELLNQEIHGKRYLNLLKHDDPEYFEKDIYPQREMLTYMTRLMIEAYRQEKISRGRLFELCKLINLPPKEILELAENNE